MLLQAGASEAWQPGHGRSQQQMDTTIKHAINSTCSELLYPATHNASGPGFFYPEEEYAGGDQCNTLKLSGLRHPARSRRGGQGVHLGDFGEPAKPCMFPTASQHCVARHKQRLLE
jgi:hypothetical protein